MESLKPPVFLVGDTGNTLTVTITDEAGAAVDLTGSTGISLKCRGENGATLTLTGTILVAANGTVNFGPPGAATGDAVPTEVGADQLLTGYTERTQSATLKKGRTPVHFRLRKWL